MYSRDGSINANERFEGLSILVNLDVRVGTQINVFAGFSFEPVTRSAKAFSPIVHWKKMTTLRVSVPRSRSGNKLGLTLAQTHYSVHYVFTVHVGKCTHSWDFLGHITSDDGYSVIAVYYPTVHEMPGYVLLLVRLEQRQFGYTLFHQSSHPNENYIVAGRIDIWNSNERKLFRNMDYKSSLTTKDLQKMS